MNLLSRLYVLLCHGKHIPFKLGITDPGTYSKLLFNSFSVFVTGYCTVTLRSLPFKRVQMRVFGIEKKTERLVQLVLPSHFFCFSFHVQITRSLVLTSKAIWLQVPCLKPLQRLTSLEVSTEASLRFFILCAPGILYLLHHKLF